jgi:ABC-type Fe3+/spermidine/putrescine transport system ATPase subunit
MDIKEGTFLCLLGPSGCGKTTLLRSIAGLEHPDAGEISIGDKKVFDAQTGRFVPAERRGLGMVFQHYALWPHMSVRDNIAYPLRKRRVSATERGGNVERLANLVGLQGHLDKRPNQLSGGQQQRVALARALAGDPKLLLLDEPLSNLDAVLRHQLRRELRTLHDRLGMTSILVTHDQEEAAALADVVAIMRNGKIVQFGTPADVLEKPATRYVAEFVGYECFVEGQIAGRQDNSAQVVLSNGDSVVIIDPKQNVDQARVTLAARGSDLKISEKTSNSKPFNAVSGRIKNSAKLGKVTEYQVEVSHETLWIRNSSEANFAQGCSVWIEIPENCPLFSDQ